MHDVTVNDIIHLIKNSTVPAIQMAIPKRPSPIKQAGQGHTHVDSEGDARTIVQVENDIKYNIFGSYDIPESVLQGSDFFAVHNVYQSLSLSFNFG